LFLDGNYKNVCFSVFGTLFLSIYHLNALQMHVSGSAISLHFISYIRTRTYICIEIEGKESHEVRFLNEAVGSTIAYLYVYINHPNMRIGMVSQLAIW
jgi:hypothetical protein